jgi:mandelate racemase
MAACPQLTFRNVQVRAVNVPMPRPLQTSGGTVGTAPLVLIDLHTEEGVTGSAYLFCYTALALKPTAQLVTDLANLIKGDAVAPIAIRETLQRQFRLLGARGLIGMALAGIDMAAWDALAKACALPLARMLGGEPRPIPAYNSCGLGIIGSARAAAEAQDLVAAGFGAIKVRLGYADAETDVEVIRAVRGAVGKDVLLMADYNQSLSIPEAIGRIRMLDDEGLAWIEEPTAAHDFAGHAQIRRESATPIQIGENWWGPDDMAKSLAAGASDLGMPDAMKIGGVTAWTRAAALAEAAGMPLSSHLFPEVSAHLLAVTPTCHWLEYVDWAEPILEAPLTIRDGCAVPADVPGIGIAWDEAAVEHCRVE